MIDKLVKNILISRNSDIKFKGSWYLISRFNHILEDFEINKLPIWYNTTTVSKEYFEIESKLMISFIALFNHYNVSALSFLDNYEDVMDLIKLNASWLNEDHFDDIESYKIFILFNLRKKHYIRKNFLNVNNQFIIDINDNLEINIYCKKNIKSNEIAKHFVENGFYVHLINSN